MSEEDLLKITLAIGLFAPLLALAFPIVDAIIKEWDNA